MKQLWVRIVLAVVALFCIAILLAPFLINGDAFRPTVEDQLSTVLGRKVELGHLDFSLFSGSLVAKNISIADDLNFSRSPFIQAKELGVGVEIGTLIFQRQVRVTRITIDSPAIQLIQNQAGKWNFSSIGGAAAHASSAQQTSAIPDLTVGELKIKNGSASVSSIPPTARAFQYSNLALDVKQFSFSKSFPFELSASLPGEGSLKLNGSAGPISEKDASMTPFHANLQLNHIDPVAAGLIEAEKGISMVADFDAKAASNGTSVSSSGKIKAAKLQLSRTGAPAPQPVEIDYEISDDLEARTGRVADLAIHAGPVAVHVTGTYKFTPKAVLLDLHLVAPNLPIDQLEQLLPVVGIRVPAGSSLRGGALTANMTITGPATEASIAGPVEIDNTTLAGFDLGSKIQGLNPFGGTGRGTDIQKLSAEIHSSPQSTQIDNIYANLPQIGTATGSGTVSSSDALDFNLVATLTSNNAVGNIANQAVNTVTNFVGGFLHPNVKTAANNTPHGIPISITGTSTNPTIRANLRAMFK